MTQTLWLASRSPRRRQLLEWAGFEVEVHPPEVPEARRPGETPVGFAVRLAAEKAATGPAAGWVLAADTVVHREARLFGKPRSREEARRHLEALAGGWHAVTTAVCLRREGHEIPFRVTTRVRFRPLSEGEIGAFVATGEADDKAGAYGIQGRAGVFVAEIQGSWTNVMGLPIEACLERLR